VCPEMAATAHPTGLQWDTKSSRRMAQRTRSPRLPNDFDAECPRQDPRDKLPNDFDA